MVVVAFLLILSWVLPRYGRQFFKRVIPQEVQNDSQRANRWFSGSLVFLIALAVVLMLTSRPEGALQWFLAGMPLIIILGFLIVMALIGRWPNRFM
jgi:Na+/citrate or Na+/malate symporter